MGGGEGHEFGEKPKNLGREFATLPVNSYKVLHRDLLWSLLLHSAVPDMCLNLSLTLLNSEKLNFPVHKLGGGGGGQMFTHPYS